MCKAADKDIHIREAVKAHAASTKRGRESSEEAAIQSKKKKARLAVQNVMSTSSQPAIETAPTQSKVVASTTGTATETATALVPVPTTQLFPILPFVLRLTSSTPATMPDPSSTPEASKN